MRHDPFAFRRTQTGEAPRTRKQGCLTARVCDVNLHIAICVFWCWACLNVLASENHVAELYQRFLEKGSAGGFVAFEREIVFPKPRALPGTGIGLAAQAPPRPGEYERPLPPQGHGHVLYIAYC